MRYFPAIILVLLLMALVTRAGAADYPQRIISLGPINTENVYLLGAGERLVADTSYCVRPAAAREKQKIGSVMQVSIEKIISLRPDLVLATGLTQPQQLLKLQNLGLRVVRFAQPESFSAICEQFIRMGRLLGLEKRAKQIVAQAKLDVQHIQEKVASLPRQKVFLQVGAQPLFGSVSTSFTHDYITLSGGSNVLADQATGTTSYEKILTRNPDVIIIAVMGTESGVAVREKEKWSTFESISAVRNKRVYLINPDLVCSPSPLTFSRTLARMAAFIHPETEAEVKQ